jgi:hypothetical protein
VIVELTRLTKSLKNIIFSNQRKHSEKPPEFRDTIIKEFKLNPYTLIPIQESDETTCTLFSLNTSLNTSLKNSN